MYNSGEQPLKFWKHNISNENIVSFEKLCTKMGRKSGSFYFILANIIKKQTYPYL